MKQKQKIIYKQTKKIISISTKNVLTHKSFNPINQINLINTKEVNDNNNIDKDNDSDSDEDDDYLLTKLREEDLSLDLKNDADNYIRKTISNFIMQKHIYFHKFVTKSEIHQP